ncbi:hypothetical protein ACFQ0D_30380 [Micromonospora zhanjiangensis]
MAKKAGTAVVAKAGPTKKAETAATKKTGPIKKVETAPARKAAAGPAAATKVAPARKKATSKLATTGRSATARKAGAAEKAAPASGQQRAYRRAPADLAPVYQRVGNATAVAAHYDVPRHTAQAWIRTMLRNTAAGG